MATPGKPLDKSTIEAIGRLTLAGKSRRAVAAALKLSTRTITKYLKALLKSTTPGE